MVQKIIPVITYTLIAMNHESNVEILEEKVHLWLESARFVKSKPGVYVLYDKKLDVIYIGGSENLQKEFSKYADTNFENDSCKQNTRSYQRMFIENPEEKKKQLLDDYKKQYGKNPCCNSDTNTQ